jgi:hypothetical protein
MEKILLERNKKEIANFRVFYKQVASYKERMEERMRLLCVNPAPLSQLEVKLYMEEAQTLC